MLGRRMATNLAVLLFYSLPASGAAFAVGYSGACDDHDGGASVVLESCLHVALFVLGFAAFRWLKYKDAAIAKMISFQARCCTFAPAIVSPEIPTDARDASAMSGAVVESCAVDAEIVLGQLAPQAPELTPTPPTPLTPKFQQREPGSPLSECEDSQSLLTPSSAFRDDAGPFSSILSPSPRHTFSVHAPASANKEEADPFAGLLGCSAHVAASESDVDAVSTAGSTSTISSTISSSTSSTASEELQESPAVPSAVITHLSKRTGRRLLKGLAAVLESKLAASSSAAHSVPLRPWRRTDFHTTETWSLSIADYLFELYWYFECSSACLPIALAYIDRARARDARMAFDHQSCHKLLLTSLVLALKFHDDEPPYYNKVYAEFGGVRKEELNELEKQFCKLLDWRLAIQPEEYDRYYHILLNSA